MAAELSPVPVATSRKSLQSLSHRLAKLPLDVIAKAIGKSDSSACRVRDGESPLTLTEWCELIEVAGLKLVSRDKYCVDKEIYDAMAAVATKAMGTPDIARRLVWDEE